MDSVRRFDVGRVLVLNTPPASVMVIHAGSDRRTAPGVEGEVEEVGDAAKGWNMGEVGDAGQGEMGAALARGEGEGEPRPDGRAISGRCEGELRPVAFIRERKMACLRRSPRGEASADG